jgi:hypothetical protein
MSAIDALAKSIATKATGYAAVINGALDVNTISVSRRLAAMKGLTIVGVHPLVVTHTDCQDPGCDCLEKWLGDAHGGRIVSIKVEVTE